MKKGFTIFTFLLMAMLVRAQTSFKTIIPQQPVTVGESFQVQYIMEDGEKVINFIAPLFTNFRVVAGPNIYSGSIASLSGAKPLKNTVYTLEAIKPGKFIIPGATASVNGQFIQSNNVVVEVISQEEALKRFSKDAGVNSEYFLRPGENVYEKIRKNLFLKVLVDKKSCYIGEPVLATFKLYSRLESKSDIVKNPGFYGFTVYDMVNLTDRLVTTEKVNGKTFDVHTIRKVQLFPLRAGIYTIDPMQIKNEVEFSRSAVFRKTEQEIVEGVLIDETKKARNENAEVFETEMSTEPVNIQVKSTPGINKPASFSGAVGSFSISSSLYHGNLAKNEEGVLEITIKGKGNFIQLNTPSIQWPAGMEGFDPLVSEFLDRQISPTTGSKTFRYAFVSGNPGEYKVPPVEFSFFNPDSGKYRTVATEPLLIHVSNKEKAVPVPATVSVAEKKQSGGMIKWIIAGIILFIGVATILFFTYRKAKKEQPDIEEIKEPVLSVDQLSAPAQLLIQADEKDFYSSLRQAIWNFFKTRYAMTGSEMNKESISRKMKEGKISADVMEELHNILHQCEAGMFTNATLPVDKSRLLQQTKTLLREIDNSLL